MKNRDIEKEKRILRASCNYFIVINFIQFMHLCGYLKPTQELIRGYCKMIDAGFYVFKGQDLKYVLEQQLGELYTEDYVRKLIEEEDL